jgi:tRNA-Thr(GGU) m(6)t(6)A37 methyltransferase TsaA
MLKSHQTSLELVLQPVGFVRNDVQSGGPDVDWKTVASVIEINPEWIAALEGIEDFSHVWVLFYFSQSPAPEAPLIHPQRREDMPLVGLFATRSPVRPNPIGLTPVELLAVEAGRLRVRGLDAVDGTPVLDLKPYLPRGDSLPDARVPDWLTRLQATQPDKH